MSVEDDDHQALERKLSYHQARSRQRARQVEDLERRLADALQGGPQGPAEPPPVYGVTRYSVFAPRDKDWVLSSSTEDVEEYRRALWSEERMSAREHVFLGWAAPVYQRFHDTHGYRHLVQYSPEMPARWLDALLDAAATYPALLPVPGGAWTDRVGAITRDLRARRAGPGPVAWLRVDDDDLLATDFLDRVVPWVTPAHRGWGISLGKGLTAEYADRRLSRFGLSTRPFVSMGQVFVGHADSSGTPHFPPGVSHVRVHQEMPTIVDSREVAYLRLLHDQQDRAHGRDVVENPTGSYAVDQLPEMLGRLFPTVVGSADLGPGPVSPSPACP